MNRENRRFERVDCEIPSSFRNLTRGSGAVLVETNVNNISEGGVAFRSNQFIPMSDHLYFQLNIPKQKPIQVKMQPAWISENSRLGQFDIGARFIDLSPDDLRIIRRLVAPKIS